MLVFANEDVGRRIYFGKFYEPYETHYFSQQIRPDDICLDVGGNVGYFSFLMAQKAKDGQVHVFEPIPLNIALLNASTVLNGFTNLQIHQCAVGSESGDITFTISNDSAYSSIYNTNRKSIAQTLSVPLISLDEYIAKNNLPRVDILKVDVEGAEKLVIDGAKKLFSDSKNSPRLVMLELYEPGLLVFSTTIDDVIATMKGFGYDTFVTPDQHSIRPYQPKDKNDYYNVFFMKSHEQT